MTQRRRFLARIARPCPSPKRGAGGGARRRSRGLGVAVEGADVGRRGSFLDEKPTAPEAGPARGIDSLSCFFCAAVQRPMRRAGETPRPAAGRTWRGACAVHGGGSFAADLAARGIGADFWSAAPALAVAPRAHGIARNWEGGVGVKARAG